MECAISSSFGFWDNISHWVLLLSQISPLWAPLVPPSFLGTLNVGEPQDSTLIPLLCSIQTNFLRCLTQPHTCKNQLYADDSHLSTFGLDINQELQVHISHCLLNTYIWRSHRNLSLITSPQKTSYSSTNLFLL